MTKPLSLLAAAALAAVCTLALPADAAAQQRAPWRNDRSCAASTGTRAFRVYEMTDSTPESRTPGPCPYSACLDLPGGRRVCGCPTDSGTYVFHIDRPGRPTQTWDAGRGSAGLSRFDVVEGDLDDDGSPELAIIRLADWSNGLGVSYWKAGVFDGWDAHGPPAELELRDYSFQGTFLRAPGGGPCRVLVARWVAGRDANRGPGLYMEARWMRYAAGGFSQDPDRPVIRRRYTNAFQDVRSREEIPGPWAWLRRHASENIPGFVEDEDGVI
jgi:hypothetical protein